MLGSSASISYSYTVKPTFFNCKKYVCFTNILHPKNVYILRSSAYFSSCKMYTIIFSKYRYIAFKYNKVIIILNKITILNKIVTKKKNIYTLLHISLHTENARIKIIMIKRKV